MKNHLILFSFIFISLLCVLSGCKDKNSLKRTKENFNSDWVFSLVDTSVNSSDSISWKAVSLPHDWSIEGSFSEDHPATCGGGALPGGKAWYKKTFSVSEQDTGKLVFIHFDGIYQNSEVYLNGHLIGKRPNGYISFRYNLTPHLKYGQDTNELLVKVDNSDQPNSRWYSGSGIYRNVYLIKTDKIHLDTWGTCITTPKVSDSLAEVNISSTIINTLSTEKEIQILHTIVDPNGKVVATVKSQNILDPKSAKTIETKTTLTDPLLWSTTSPSLYSLNTTIQSEDEVLDNTSTRFGVRNFRFDVEKGFFLNDNPLKILGVCNHHDLGCLGAAVNKRAIERQLEILKKMGCNGIRTSHNPPAPELLDLCDEMGFIVMDETFDMWKMTKTKHDYSKYYDDWHVKDLTDHILRDRNHPSVILWSIGNEILEQWDTSGVRMTKELVSIVRTLDPTRPITTGNNFVDPDNALIKAGVLDIIGFNYKVNLYEKAPELFPGKPLIATETTSGLMTRGYYELPYDTLRRWPVDWRNPGVEGRTDNTVSSYDHVSTPWGSTHEEAWKVIKNLDFISGMFIWTGFDYIGEPTPYEWPSRSSYFGIIDLAGFPKDVYYMYQSEWTDEPVLHLLPHWNWTEGETVDVIAYTNCDKVELFLNDSTLGTKMKGPDDLHLRWKVPYTPGKLHAIGWINDTITLDKTISTASEPQNIRMECDRYSIKADGEDLSFITVSVLDKDGNIVPMADNMINFEIVGEATIAGVDNGDPVSHEPFKANYRKTFNGKCLVVVKSGTSPGMVTVKAVSEGLTPASVKLTLE